MAYFADQPQPQWQPTQHQTQQQQDDYYFSTTNTNYDNSNSISNLINDKISKPPEGYIPYVLHTLLNDNETDVVNKDTGTVVTKNVFIFYVDT